jgi:hypothetical protein
MSFPLLLNTLQGSRCVFLRYKRERDVCRLRSSFSPTRTRSLVGRVRNMRHCCNVVFFLPKYGLALACCGRLLHLTVANEQQHVELQWYRRTTEFLHAALFPTEQGVRRNITKFVLCWNYEKLPAMFFSLSQRAMLQWYAVRFCCLFQLSQSQ